MNVEALMTGATVDLLEIQPRPEWHADALCREHPEISWFPEHGESTTPARAVCARCLVREECLEYALDDPGALRWGVWGGTTERERRALRRQGRVAA
jgi:WhiB family redox-sensing transcriptional regulator